MKPVHYIFTIAAASLWFACAQFFTAAPSLAQSPEKPKNLEIREFKIGDGISVRFEAERIDAREWLKATGTGTGFINHNGKVYIGESNPPHRILTSGVMELEGRESLWMSQACPTRGLSRRNCFPAWFTLSPEPGTGTSGRILKCSL